MSQRRIPATLGALSRSQRSRPIEDPSVFEPAAGGGEREQEPQPLAVPFSNGPFTLTGESAELAPANPKRRYLLIQNKSASDLFVSFGRPASAEDGAGSLLIPAGGNYEPVHCVPANSINVFGTGSGVIVEG